MVNINNINRMNFLKIFLGCICAISLVACSTAPITERKQLKLIPESTLNKQAAQIYINVQRKTKLSDDKKQLEEIKEIGLNIENAVSAYFASINKYSEKSLEVLHPINQTYLLGCLLRLPIVRL